MTTPTPEKSGGSPQNDRADAMSALIAEILNSAEVRQVLTGVGRQWLCNWSRNNRLKQGMGRPMAWAWSRLLSLAVENDLAGIFEKPEHIEALSREIPGMVGGLGDIGLAVARAVEAFPPDRKKELFRNLFSSQGGKPGGPPPVSPARIAEDLYKDDPHFFSNQIIPLLESRLSQTDFGELKALFDIAGADLKALLTRGVGLIFEYPAKLIALLAVLPEGVNLLFSAVEAFLERLNSLPPDILTDLLLSLFREVDGTTVGKTITRINEAIRQLHTGSTLIGEMDAPKFSADLRNKIRTVLAETDPGLAVKARNALIDGRETVIGELMDAAAEHPEILNLWLNQLAVKRNSNIRLFKRKMDIFESLPEEEAMAALAAGLSGWNAYDLAETVNALNRTINRIGQVNPELFEGLVTEFVNTLDLYELEDSLDRLSRDLARAVRPVFRMAAPPIIREFCDFFNPGEEDDGYDEAMEQARNRLRRLFLGKENS